MKTMKKCTLLLIVAFTFSLAVGIFGLTGAFNKTVFAVEGANVAMVDGASVKINGTGIRFQSLIKKTYYDGLAEGKKTGIAIIPADLLQGELNQSTDKAMLLYAAAQAHDDEKYAGYYVYNYALTDIPETSFGRKMTARAFVKNGEEYIWADNVQSRSLAYVASAALQADSMGEAKYTAEQKTALNGYIDGAVESISLETDKVSVSKAQDIIVGNTAEALNVNIIPVNESDDLSDLKILYTSDNADAISVEGSTLKANKVGFANVTIAIGSKTAKIRAFSNSEKYTVFATAENQKIEYSLPEGWSAELFIDDKTSLGSVENIVIPDTVKEDKTKHKLYNGYPSKIQVKAEGEAAQFTRPNLLLATAEINNAKEWAMYMHCAANEAIYGYYILNKDITTYSSNTDIVNPYSGGTLSAVVTTDGKYGFRGTLDGNGKTISYTGRIGGGLVSALGKGAVVKNLTVTNGNAAKNQLDWFTGQIFGGVIVGTTLENVTINFSANCNIYDTKTIWGPLAYQGFRSSVVNNLVINVYGKVNTIIGGGNANYQIYDTKFTNCEVNVYPDAQLKELGHKGNESSTELYCGENETIEGRTPLAGFKVNYIEATAQTLSRQNISLAADAAAIDLGGYSDYTVTEITCDGEDLGKNPQNLALTENIKKKQVKL